MAGRCAARSRGRAGLVLSAMLVAVLFTALPAAAQDLADLPLEDLLKVEISTASRYPQEARQAPSQVQWITADDIARHGWRTLGEALSSLPGMYVSDDRAYQYLGSRGFLIPGDYSTRFLLLLDGQRMNDNLFEQAHFGFSFPLDLSLVERIEVIPGPGSALYGSNALFGVINVITRKPGTRAQQQVAGTLTSDGWRELRTSMQRQLGEDGPHLTASVGVARKDARDLTVAGSGVARNLDASELARAYLSIDKAGLKLSAWLTQREVRPASALYGSLFNDPRLLLRDEVAGVSAALERTLATDLQFSGRLTLQEQSFRGVYPFDDQQGGSYLNRDDMRGLWWSADSRFLYTGLRGHTLIYGLDLQHDTRASLRNVDVAASGTPLFATDQPGWRGGIYLQDEWAFARDWRLSAGLRHDRYATGIDHSSPRLGLVWSADPRTTLKLLAGIAHRVPSAYERLYASPPYVANLSLSPERIRTTELVAERTVASDQRLGMSVYSYRIQRLIEQVGINNDTEYQFQNASGAVTSRGVELYWKAYHSGGGSAAASVALNRTRDENGAKIANSPGWIAKLRVARPLAGERWQASAELDAIGPREVESASAWQRLGPQWWVNAVLSAQALTPGSRVTLRVVNLFDRDLQMPVGESVSPLLPFYGRTLQLTVSHAY